LTISSDIERCIEKRLRGFEEQRGESMNVEPIFGKARRDEARAVAHGAGRRVGRSNPENVVNGFRGFEVL
jgi:hypothetical protein